MTLNYEQAIAYDEISEWYEDREKHKICLSAPVYSAPWTIVSFVISRFKINPDEVKILSFSQKETVTLCRAGYDCEYINEYLYEHYVLPVDKEKDYLRKVYNGIDPDVYDHRQVRTFLTNRNPERDPPVTIKLVVVSGGECLDKETLKDIEFMFQVPIIILHDPYRIGIPGAVYETKKPKIRLSMLSDDMMDELNLFLHRMIETKMLYVGSTRNVNVIEEENVGSLRNKRHDVWLTNTSIQAGRMWDETNPHAQSTRFYAGDRVICMTNRWDMSLEQDKYYLTKGMIGTLSVAYRSSADGLFHGRFVPDFTKKAFTDLIISRPGEIIGSEQYTNFEQASILNVAKAARWKFDSVLYFGTKTLENDVETKLTYTAISSATKSIDIVI